MAVTLTKDNFDAEVLRSPMPVLVDFWAEWCGPCRMLGPTIEALAEEYQGKVKVCKLNVDDEQELAAKYGVMSIPTVIVFSGGEVKNTSVGAVPKEKLVALFNALL